MSLPCTSPIGPNVRPIPLCAKPSVASTLIGNAFVLTSFARILVSRPRVIGSGMILMPPSTYGASMSGRSGFVSAVNVTVDGWLRANSQRVCKSVVAVRTASPGADDVMYANVEPLTSVIPPSVTLPSVLLRCRVRPGSGTPLPLRSASFTNMRAMLSPGANQRCGVIDRMSVSLGATGPGSASGAERNGFTATAPCTLLPEPPLLHVVAGPDAAPHQLFVAWNA